MKYVTILIFIKCLECLDDTNKDVDDEIMQENIIAAIEPKSITTFIRCSVHTLQLCINDGLKTAAIASCIIQARKVIYYKLL